MLELRQPSLDLVPHYAQAVEKGWSPNTTRGLNEDELAFLTQHPEKFVAQEKGENLSNSVLLPDGTRVPRLPSFARWMWDGEFCGNIGFRWQPGTTELPSHVMGHIGYAVVQWKQKKGYAKEALRLLLGEIKRLNLEFVEISTDTDNVASQKIIMSNNGQLLGQFPHQYGGTQYLRYRVYL